eukprot:TRINITY_DN5944_c0_g2_i2.p1 TRINITY_DN5944_c0_g2~~TRINITY_DN5944_c0_g2_i2.p1  ORF type:complete len:518 (-),score=21.95 TRINITY_DN5944_c0_g2_i2:1599-3152(-)
MATDNTYQKQPNVFASLNESDLHRILVSKAFENEQWKFEQRSKIRYLNKFWRDQCDKNVTQIPSINLNTKYEVPIRDQLFNNSQGGEILQLQLEQLPTYFPNLQYLDLSRYTPQTDQEFYRYFSLISKFQNLKKIELGDLSEDNLWFTQLFFMPKKNNNVVKELQDKQIEFVCSCFDHFCLLRFLYLGLITSVRLGEQLTREWTSIVNLFVLYDNFMIESMEVNSLFEELIQFKNRIKGITLPFWNSWFVLQLLQNNETLQCINVSSDRWGLQQTQDLRTYQYQEELIKELKLRQRVGWDIVTEFDVNQLQSIQQATDIDLSSVSIIQQEKLKGLQDIRSIKISKQCSRRGILNFQQHAQRKFEVSDIFNEQLQQLPHLKEIRLYRKQFWRSIDFAQLTQLNRLTISLEKGINPPELDVLQKLTNLQELELNSDFPGPCKIDRFGFLEDLKKLQCLKLTNIAIRTNKMTFKEIESLKSLQCIIIQSQAVREDLKQLLQYKEAFLRAVQGYDINVIIA